LAAHAGLALQFDTFGARLIGGMIAPSAANVSKRGFGPQTERIERHGARMLAGAADRKDSARPRDSTPAIEMVACERRLLPDAHPNSGR
jgi:hypothetical protein